MPATDVPFTLTALGHGLAASPGSVPLELEPAVASGESCGLVGVGGVQRIQIREGCFRYEMARREEFVLVRRSFALHEETLARLDRWIWSVDECFYQRRASRGDGSIKQRNKARRMPRERGLGAGFESLEDAEIIVSRYFGAPIVGGGGAELVTKDFPRHEGEALNKLLSESPEIPE